MTPDKVREWIMAQDKESRPELWRRYYDILQVYDEMSPEVAEEFARKAFGDMVEGR